MKKAQSSIEFFLIACAMFFIFLGMFVLIQGKITEAYRFRLYNSFEGLSNLLITEITLAESAQGYYSREFFLPHIVSGYNYSIALYANSEIVVTVYDFEYVIFLDHNVSGNIGKGHNLIRNIEDNISITYIG